MQQMMLDKINIVCNRRFIMKYRKLIFLFFIILFIASGIIYYICKVNKKGDHVLFEYSHYISPPVVKDDYYFALKDNNELIWMYGTGELGMWTYAGYFMDVEEKGIVKLTEEEKENLYEHMKKIIKYCEPTESDYCVDEDDGVEVIIKYENNYYNECQTVDKYGWHKYSDYEYRFETLQDELISIVDKYKEINGYDIYGIQSYDTKLYMYN